MVVARTGMVDAARVLLKHGANVNAAERWRGQTALMRAAAQNQTAMVRERVAHSADVNARSTVNDWQRQVTVEPRAIYRPAGGWTPRLSAAREGCVACAAVLADAGANLNLTDPDGISPLLLAVINTRSPRTLTPARRTALEEVLSCVPADARWCRSAAGCFATHRTMLRGSGPGPRSNGQHVSRYLRDGIRI